MKENKELLEETVGTADVFSDVSIQGQMWLPSWVEMSTECRSRPGPCIADLCRGSSSGFPTPLYSRQIQLLLTLPLQMRRRQGPDDQGRT